MSFPEYDSFADDELDQEQLADEQEQKPSIDWRSAPDMDSFLERYAADGGELDGYESVQHQQQVVAQRDARVRQAQEHQREVMEKWQNGERPAWAEAKSLAEMMVLYQKDSGIVSDGWTVAEDSDGRLQVYEVD